GEAREKGGGKRGDPSAPGERSTGRSARRKTKPGIDAVPHLQDRGDVGARAEEGGMAERILPAVAAENVPALPHQREHERSHEEIKRDVRVHDKRHCRQDPEYCGNRKESPHARAPNKPLGRTRSTTIKMRKIPICPSDSPRKSPDKLSATPISSAPTSAPGTDPMPPSTTIVNATRTKASPTLGLT